MISTEVANALAMSKLHAIAHVANKAWVDEGKVNLPEGLPYMFDRNRVYFDDAEEANHENLARFVIAEIIDTYDPDDPKPCNTAIDNLHRGIEDLVHVINAIRHLAVETGEGRS